MHSFGVVLLAHDTADARSSIAELLAPYNSEMEVEEYKQFYSTERALELAKHHGAGADLALLVRILQQKGYDDVGLDAGRFYRRSQYNTNGKWDYWSVGGAYDHSLSNEATALIGQQKGWDTDVCANICLVALLPADVIPAELITPTGKWHSCEDFGWRMISSPAEQAQAWAEWEAHARQVLQQFADCIAVGLDIHS